MIKRLHEGSDGVFREQAAVTAVGLRLVKLDPAGQPTGEVLHAEGVARVDLEWTDTTSGAARSPAVTGRRLPRMEHG